MIGVSDFRAATPVIIFSTSLNINGGEDKIKYAFSYNHMNDKAIYEVHHINVITSLKLRTTKSADRMHIDFSMLFRH